MVSLHSNRKVRQHVCRCLQRPEKGLDPLDLELQSVVSCTWMLETKHVTSAAAISTLTAKLSHCSIPIPGSWPPGGTHKQEVEFIISGWLFYQPFLNSEVFKEIPNCWGVSTSLHTWKSSKVMQRHRNSAIPTDPPEYTPRFFCLNDTKLNAL